MSNEFQIKANNIFNFMEANASIIVGIAVVVFFSYFYFRNKINLKYLLDFFIVSIVLLTLYIILAPHRYHGVSNFIIYVFR